MSSTSVAQDPSKSDLTTIDDPKLWVKSPYPEVKIIEEVEIHELLFKRMGMLGHLPALTCGITGKQVTFDQLEKQSKSFGTALTRAGHVKGDVAALVLPNMPEFAMALLGCWCAGLSVATINPRYTEHETMRQLEAAEAQVVITSEDNVDTVMKAKGSSTCITSVILVGDIVSRAGCKSFRDLINDENTNEIAFSTGKGTDTKETIAWLPFSSGTTGPPKLVITTHAHFVTQLLQYTRDDIIPTKSFHHTGCQERILAIAPFFHAYGMMYGMLSGLYQGAHIATLPRFKPDTFLKAIREHKPTCVNLVPPLIQHIVQSADYTAKELESLHSIGGAEIRSE